MTTNPTRHNKPAERMTLMSTYIAKHKSPTDDTTPAGFCPRCDYPINPGICPECGNHFEADQLARLPRATRRRQQIRRVAALVLIIAASIGLHRLYESRLWTRCLPTSWLFAMDPTTSWATDEILRRDIKGELSEEERLAQYHRTFAIRTSIRSPRPIGDEFAIRVSVDSMPGTPNHSIRHNIDDAQIFFDGQPVEIPDNFMLYKSNACRCRLPMQPGKHIISGSMTAELGLSDRTRPFSTYSKLAFPIEFSHEVVVEEKQLSDVVTARFDDELMASLQEQLFVSVCRVGTPHQARLSIRFDNATIPLAGEFVVRLHDLELPLLKSEVAFPPSKRATASSITFQIPQGTAPADAFFDIQFTPDLRVAFEAGSDGCFAGIIEWHGVRLGTNNGNMKCELCLPPFDWNPDVVRAWKPEETPSTP